MADFASRFLSDLDLDQVFEQYKLPFRWNGFRLFVSRLAASLNYHLGMDSLTINMADAAHALVMKDATGAQTNLTATTLFVDPNSGGVSEELSFPAAATLGKGRWFIVNTGGEGIVIKDAAAATLTTIAAAKIGVVICDGTTIKAGTMS